MMLDIVLARNAALELTDDEVVEISDDDGVLEVAEISDDDYDGGYEVMEISDDDDFWGDAGLWDDDGRLHDPG